MKTLKILISALILAVATPAISQSSHVTIETTAGNIRIVLFDDTPVHRDNFLRLADEHFYDSLLFHRVIKNFMIQGGDPDSRHAEPGKLLGGGDTGYTLAPELFAADGRLLHHHRRGAVAMAREGDDINPERRSSGCQFYIVWGKLWPSTELEAIGKRLDAMTQHRVTMTPEMVSLYHKTGGTPHLDGQYTVFGEVVEGLDVVERIQRVFTDDDDRPVDDVRIVKIRRTP